VKLSRAPAPQPAFRLIPSRFPPIGLFDTVATGSDLAAVMELVGWTNDRLVAHRIARLPEAEWVYGRPNASIVMAAFLHVAPGGSRFNGPDLGAWYAAAEIRTAAAEVAHHLRREAADRGIASLERTYRAYTCRLAGDHVDIVGRKGVDPAVFASASYGASQAFGEKLRGDGEAGILYGSLRFAGGLNVVAFRPRHILDVVQSDHFRITASADSRAIHVVKLGAAPAG
jgi:predicted NUDIX family NTP pyrophosphohydrolase